MQANAGPDALAPGEAAPLLPSAQRRPPDASPPADAATPHVLPQDLIIPATYHPKKYEDSPLLGAPALERSILAVFKGGRRCIQVHLLLLFGCGQEGSLVAAGLRGEGPSLPTACDSMRPASAPSRHAHHGKPPQIGSDPTSPPLPAVRECRPHANGEPSLQPAHAAAHGKLHK